VITVLETPVVANTGLNLMTFSSGKYKYIICLGANKIPSFDCIRNCTLPGPSMEGGEIQMARVADTHIAGTIDTFPKTQLTPRDHWVK